MTEGEITEWLVEDGDSVKAGDSIYTLATDKTETDIESPAAGTIRILGETEQVYPVGTVVGRIE